jgi:hypothetical protein
VNDTSELIAHILIDHYISAYYYVPAQCNAISKKIETMFLKNPELKRVVDAEHYRIEWYRNSIREIYGQAGDQAVDQSNKPKP